MKRFVKTTVPSDGYKEVQQIGDRYLVHMEGVQDGDATTCYECMTDSEPDIAELTAELQTWKAYVAERELAVVKMVKKQELMEYDSSSAVNSFEIRRGGEKLTDYWLPRDLRTSLDGDVRACMAQGHSVYVFDIREMDVSLSLDCQKFLDALTTLREYAYTAYNVTSKHLAAIDALGTKEAVESYDFTTGYPSKLEFNLEDLI